MSRQPRTRLAFFSVALLLAGGQNLFAEDGVFVRMKLVAPQTTKYYVKIGGHTHNDPWHIPGVAAPLEADKMPEKRIPGGEFTPWVDLMNTPWVEEKERKKMRGRPLHGRQNRAGGIAEFPNITADFITEPASDDRHVVIELATEPDPAKVVKRFEEKYKGSLTSFLASPRLVADNDSLETAAEMSARRLQWAKEATGGVAHTPKRLILQTNFWSPQRPELNLQEAEVVRLLGFNMVGNQSTEVQAKKWFRIPGHTHDTPFQPSATQQSVHDAIFGKNKPAKPRKKKKTNPKAPLEAGTIFNFSDEITTRPIGKEPLGKAFFVEWLRKKGVAPADLCLSKLEDVVHIDNPKELRERQQTNLRAANRIFYYTSRFRQEATSERFRWLSEAVHDLHGPEIQTSTLTADHPYFGNTGLGMGMGPDPAWHATALAADWFDLARTKAVDIVGVEDWMGLQFMYGPNYTFEGFQLMGFQASMIRSGGRGETPCISWVTPSDETNLRLKFASSLAQGAKHLFFWTYGPTATSTENYWSDIRSAYDGMAHVSKQAAQAEHIIAPGKTRPTRVALLYSISSDLWQPFGYVHMLERRATYFSLIHQQYLVDMLTEEDILADRLKSYNVLYVTDPNIRDDAMVKMEAWVQDGGTIHGSTAAGTRNEFNEEVTGLSRVFGIHPKPRTVAQSGTYYRRGELNHMAYTDQINGQTPGGKSCKLGVLGVKVSLKVTDGKATAYFSDGRPAVVSHSFGRGKAVCYGACPGLAYLKDAKFVPDKLAEKWPAAIRDAINESVRRRGVARLVELSHPVVEAGIYDSDAGSALVLGNFTYQPIPELKVRLTTPKPVKSVRSIERGPIKFETEFAADSPAKTSFTVNLGINDVVILE